MTDMSRRLRLSMLWVYMAVAMPTALALVIISPGVMKEFLRTGAYEGTAITDAMTLQMAVFTIVPLAMAVLTLSLAPIVNRWANVVLGLVMAVFDGMDLVAHLGGAFGGEVLLTATMVVVSLLIAWFGFRLPVSPQAAVRRDRELVHH